MDFSRQPMKGVFFALASIPGAVFLWFILIRVYGLDFGQGALFFTICFTYFWHIGWSFQGWPVCLWTQSRWVQGIVNWVIHHALVWLTLALWAWAYSKPFSDTPVGLWGQTTIIAAVLNLFLFGNLILLPAEYAGRQPLAGLTNLLWAVLFFPTALFFMPTMWGGEPAYIPWIWFPVALIPAAYFGGWPFDRLGIRSGISYTGVVFFLTFVMLVILDFAGMGFFKPGDAGLKAAIFGATWTNVGIVLAWLFNMWPVGTWGQPLRGTVTTLGTVIVSIAIFGWILGVFPAEELPAVLFWQFAYMWAVVSFAGIGFFNVFQWGYEKDPLGAGLRPAPLRPVEQRG